MLTSEKSGTPHKKNSMERIIFATAFQYEPADESRYSDLCCDLSQGGLYLQTVYPFDTDEKLALCFAIPKPKQDIAISCSARIAWTNLETKRRKTEYPPGAGLQFLDLSGADETTLAEFMDAYAENKKCKWPVPGVANTWACAKGRMEQQATGSVPSAVRQLLEVFHPQQIFCSAAHSSARPALSGKSSGRLYRHLCSFDPKLIFM